MQLCPLLTEKSEYCSPLPDSYLKEEMKAIGLENFTTPICIDIHPWMIGTLPDIIRSNLPPIIDQENGLKKICFCKTNNCNNQDLLETPSSSTILPCQGREPCLR